MMVTRHPRTRRPSTPALLALAALLGAALAPAPARADESAEAKESFFTAEAYYRKGDYKQAVLNYERAYSLKPHPSVLYNIAECYERLSEFQRATENYERYLADAPQARIAPRSRPSSRATAASPPACR